MTSNPTQICPHCGKPMRQPKANPAQENTEAQEYDHRGVLMPRRTKIGGIIIPQ